MRRHLLSLVVVLLASSITEAQSVFDLGPAITPAQVGLPEGTTFRFIEVDATHPGREILAISFDTVDLDTPPVPYMGLTLVNPTTLCKEGGIGILHGESIVTGDLNGDGKDDALVTLSDGRTQVLEGRGFQICR